MAGVRQFDEVMVARKALEVFWARGFAATSMQHLAEATGVIRGSLYNAYGSKEALFEEAYRLHSGEFLVNAERMLAHEQPDKALRAFLDFLVDSMTAGEPSRGCLTTKTATEEGAHADAVRPLLRGYLDGLERLVLARLSLPDAKPRLALLPKDATRLVMVVTRGLVVVERVYQDKPRLRKTVDSLVKLLFPG